MDTSREATTEMESNIPYIVTNDRYMIEAGILDPADEEVMRGKQPIRPEAIVDLHGDQIESGQLEEAPTGPPDPDSIPLTPEMMQHMTQATGEAMRFFEQMVSQLMSPKKAKLVRELRCNKRHSWRALAAECFRTWPNMSWDPPSNQLLGMELCCQSAKLFGEDWEEDPWN